ncbi:MAG: MDR family MFS transporter [Dehalococcoidia bacterium]
MTQVQPPRPLSETLTPRQKWLLLGSLMMAMFISALDMTVVSTATPRILADLGGFHLLSWLFTSYMLSSTVLVPLVGKLSDIYGRKIFIIAGISVFLVASVFCGLAQSMLQLIILRALQGVGSGIIMAAVFPALGDIFAPAERGKYMGLFTGMFSLAAILGPALGGVLTDHGSWRLVFFLNIPICAVAIPAIWANLPSRPSTRRPRIDYVGAVLLAVGSVAALLALEWAGSKQYAWGSVQIIGLFSGASACVALFILQERRHPEPIIPLHLFRNNVFLVSNLLVLLMGMGMFGALQYLGIFVQTALRASATASGVIGTPQSLGMLVASVIAGQMMSRTGHYKVQAIVGSIFVLVAMLFLRTLNTSVAQWQISAYMVILGLGFGAMMPPLSLAVQNAVSHEYIGVASSTNQFFRQVGSVFGIAVFAVILTNSYESSFQDELSADAKAQLGPERLAIFNDPTVALNERQFALVTASIREEPGGPELVAAATAAQRESVAAAVRDIFTVATVVAALGILLLLLLKEVPLRRDNAPAPAPEGAHAGPEGRAAGPSEVSPSPGAVGGQ